MARSPVDRLRGRPSQKRLGQENSPFAPGMATPPPLATTSCRGRRHGGRSRSIAARHSKHRPHPPCRREECRCTGTVPLARRAAHENRWWRTLLVDKAVEPVPCRVVLGDRRSADGDVAAHGISNSACLFSSILVQRKLARLPDHDASPLAGVQISASLDSKWTPRDLFRDVEERKHFRKSMF